MIYNGCKAIALKGTPKLLAKGIGIATAVDANGKPVYGYQVLTSASAAIGTITRAPLTVTGVSADSKTYDGNSDATLNTANTITSGIFVNDQLIWEGGAGSFSDRNVGNNKTVTASGLVLSGADAGNYFLASLPTGLTANITPLASVAWTGAVQKTVDQVTSAIASSTAIASTSGSTSSQTSSFSDTQTSLKESQQEAQSTAGSSSSSPLKLIAVGYSRGGNEGEFGSEEGASPSKGGKGNEDSKANGKGNEDSKGKGKGKQSTGKTSKTSKPAANCN